jgi:hypothetical protein
VQRKKIVENRLFLILVLAIIAMIVNCDQCDPSTDESDEMPYSGSVTALEPYGETTDLVTRPISCGDTYCTYTAIAEVMIHNPTDRTVTAKVTCNYMVGDYLAATNSREDIELKPRSDTTGTKKVEMEHFVDLEAEQGGSIGVDCDVEFF